MKHVNFYENEAEASMRLAHSIVLYDDKPYYVLAVTDHKPDGILRIYLDPLGQKQGMSHRRYSIPYDWMNTGLPGQSRGDKMDEFLESHKDSGVIRKMMNSPKFNRFRPFRLGMCNNSGFVQYIERSPTRHTQQGLTSTMVVVKTVGLDNNRPGMSFDQFGLSFYDTIMGNYPTADDCLKALTNKDIANEGAAFHRDFALIRGPMSMVFLAYKEDVIGRLPERDFGTIDISPEFIHTKEVVESLNLFKDIRITDV